MPVLFVGCVGFVLGVFALCVVALGLFGCLLVGFALFGLYCLRLCCIVFS